MPRRRPLSGERRPGRPGGTLSRALDSRTATIAVIGVVLIVAALAFFAATAPSVTDARPPLPGHSGPAVPSTVSDPRPGTVKGRAMPAGSACSPPEGNATTLRRWLRRHTDQLLGYGTRVAGSGSPGMHAAHQFVRLLADCPDDDAGAQLWHTDAAPRHGAVWEHRFSAPTPLGERSFVNFVTRFNHPAPGGPMPPEGHLVLAAHHDSKRFDERRTVFLGACDSAVPVVMLLQLARSLTALGKDRGGDAAAMAERRQQGLPPVPGLPAVSLLFLDGEEAFVEWRGSDNTYGSRRLAEHYEKHGLLQDISAFVLLDLIGPARLQFRNFFPKATGPMHRALHDIEHRMRRDGAFGGPRPLPAFPSEPKGYPGRVEDDHVPWLQRGVPVLHLIPVPFPTTWHTAADDVRSVDFAVTADTHAVIREFVLGFDARRYRPSA